MGREDREGFLPLSRKVDCNSMLCFLCYFLQRRKSVDFGKLVHNIDYKFIIIPIAFVLLRMGSLVENIIFIYIDKPHVPPKFHKIIGYIAVSSVV